VLATDPRVAQAYVVGAADEQTGEAVHAFVVPATDEAPDLDGLVALVRAG
jgi:acyl-coenzyme A synthetase/AMP-(fatty) acid ligase